MRAVLHTGHQHERVALEGIEVCPCSWWPRDVRRGPRRSAGIAARFVTRTLPHLRRAVPRGSVLHVEGTSAAGPLTTIALASARAAGRRVVYSPHDTFGRRSALDARVQRLALRIPHALIVHSEADVAVLREAGLRARLARDLGVQVAARIGFLDLVDFAAALVAADVVVAPHEKASQSGVLSVAAQLGVPTVASAVGGLGELADRTFAPGDVAGLTRAIDSLLADGGGPQPPMDEASALRAHLAEYLRCAPQGPGIGSPPA